MQYRNGPDDQRGSATLLHIARGGTSGFVMWLRQVRIEGVIAVCTSVGGAWDAFAMGVMYDYFAASSDEAAAATIDLPGGPGGPLPPLPMPFRDLVAQYGLEGARRFLRSTVRLSDAGVPALFTKGFDPTTDLSTVHALLTGARPDVLLDQLGDAVIAERDGGEQLILSISAEVRDSLAASTPGGLQRAEAEWVEVEAPYRRVDVEGVSGLLEQLAELARMARDRGDGLYCWMCV